MISFAASDYWKLCQSYRTQPASRHMQALLLNGEALLVLQGTKSPAVKTRCRSFIGLECAHLGLQDKSAAFLTT
jgi:hypothetical protein